MSLPNTEAIDNSYQHLSNQERKMISCEDVVFSALLLLCRVVCLWPQRSETDLDKMSTGESFS